MESVTELYVQKDENEYYVLITDMGEFQKVYIADHPLMDEYKRIIHLPNDEFKHEIDTFEASAIYVENKEASAWYDIKESPFEPAVKLTALVSKECPYGTEETYVKKAKETIADYLDCRLIAINTLIGEKQVLVDDLQTYKKSLIYEVVTGKKRVVV